MAADSASTVDLHVFDTTLRDGAQREGVSYSVADKLAVARLLDEIGVGFIEGGWPGALPKDTEFFSRARTELKLRHALLVAFGSTRKAGVAVEDDPQVKALLDAETPVVCLVAKSDVRHVHDALRTTLEENLAMVADTVAFFVRHGRRVFLDCEHFFDGYKTDRDYGVRVLEAAFGAGGEGRLQHPDGVVVVVRVAVEEVLAVEEHPAPVAHEEGDGVGHHREVLLERRPQRLAHVPDVGLGDQADDRRLGVQQGLDLRVVLDGDAGLARGAERHEQRVPQLELGAGAREELGVLRERPGPATLDEPHPDVVEQPGDGELVRDGVADALALGAVAQGGVEDVEVEIGGHGVLLEGVDCSRQTKRPPGYGRSARSRERTAR